MIWVFMDPMWIPICILYETLCGSSRDPVYRSLYGSNLDPIWILYESLYESYMDPNMDPYLDPI